VDDEGSNPDVGQYSSIAINPSAYGRISYYDATHHWLKYVEQTGPTTWGSPQVVDNTGGTDVGSYTSIALDPVGASHYARIAYYDATNNRLKFASYNGSTWTYSAVPSTVGGQYASLALDPTTGDARISYYDPASHRLMYVSQTSGSWNAPQVVDSAGSVGRYCSLGLDGSGNPRISYYDATNTNLKCALWAVTAWDLETADTGGSSNVGLYTSIKIDPATGKAKIIYFDASASAVKYAVQQ
jgi:hypothetical protein